MKSRIYLVAAMMALMLTFGAGSAMADIQFQLTQDNCTGGCNPGAPGTSMGTVTLHDNTGGSVTVTVALVSPLRFVNTGLHETIDFNLAGTPMITGFTTSNTNFSLTSPNAGSNMFDGFGNFQYAVQLNTGQGGNNSVASPETFTITAAGLTLSSFVGNAGGWFFGVDVFSNNLNGGTGNGNTGPIGTNSNGTLTNTGSVPEPTSIVLLGSVLVGLASVIRRKTQPNA